MLDNRNFLLAIVLSLAVLIGWQFFIAGPEMERLQQQQAQQQAAQQQATTGDAASTTTPGATAPAGTLPVPTTGDAGLTVSDALAQSTRVAIETPSVTGSLNLT